MLNKNHYIQNRLLKNFAIKAENGKYKICVLDLIKFDANYRNTDNCFCQKNLYDMASGDDVKELEKKFNDLIEKPMSKLLQRICSAKETVSFTRTELNIVKKYFLLQHYRTPRNRMSYTNPKKNAFELSQYNLQEGESKEDFWKREMLTILEHDMFELVQSDMIGVRKHAMEANSSFMMIIRTNNEFCINDIGYVTERMPVQIPKDKEADYIKTAKEIGKELYGQDNFDELARREIANQSSYFDNYVFHPISSNCALIMVSPEWKYVPLYPNLLNELQLFSPILLKYLTFPKNDYVNWDKMKEAKQDDIPQYFTQEDKFIYTIQTVNKDETIYLNHLIMNEAFCYIGCKTPSELIPSIRKYNELRAAGQQNMHHDFNGYVELLSKL
ncbi:MAG: DUF4238 domain-containing protein [Clostridiales bacterium]|nr:DUF4238 domain-containing protein [Clostridiales bacterium]